MARKSLSAREPLILYRDRRFTVTASDVHAWNEYYPLADTVGRIRRDPLYMALCYAAVVGFALAVYFDLWRPLERLAMGGSIALTLLLGTQISVLRLDARGFPARLFIGRTSTIRKVFKAITLARALTARTTGGFDPDEVEDDREDEE